MPKWITLPVSLLALFIAGVCLVLLLTDSTDALLEPFTCRAGERRSGSEETLNPQNPAALPPAEKRLCVGEESSERFLMMQLVAPCLFCLMTLSCLVGVGGFLGSAGLASRRAGRGTVGGASLTSATAAPVLGEDWNQRVRRRLQDGHEMGAIKDLEFGIPCSVQQARAYVEHVALEMQLDPAVRRQVFEELQAERKINAIKLVRNGLQLTLREAKGFTEWLPEEHGH